MQKKMKYKSFWIINGRLSNSRSYLITAVSESRNNMWNGLASPSELTTSNGKSRNHDRSTKYSRGLLSRHTCSDNRAF